MEQNNIICKERHKSLDDKLVRHEERLNNHSNRIDKLEQYQNRAEVKMDNLCEQIKNLVTTMRWFMGLLVGSFIGFFFYAAQKGLLK